jgi:uncharacterized protein YdhG (YjbR/CyaY superfamily)
MDDAVQACVDAIATEFRPLFDRIHRLILATHPEALVALSYQMPTYQVGRRRLYVAAWKHGISLHGWQADHDTGFLARHPELRYSKGTIRLRPEDADDISDDELSALVRAALAA